MRLFWFSCKIAHVHKSGRQNKNKQKEERLESSTADLLNLHQFCNREFWEYYARQLRSIRMYKSKVNYIFTILSHTISETISWAKNKMGHSCEEGKMASWKNK